jgi:hypothetical protein
MAASLVGGRGGHRATSQSWMNVSPMKMPQTLRSGLQMTGSPSAHGGGGGGGGAQNGGGGGVSTHHGGGP